jgi:ATP-dependent helicase/nuclease subunit A
MRDLRLPFDDPPGIEEPADVARDRAARARAVDPRCNVVLEASAGTGKTRVLVDRYVNLLRAGVDPSNILAITFTRKAAAEMRDRIVGTLRTAAARHEIPPSRWLDLRPRLGDIAISTIDAFCLGLLREFPLEADVDPGFAMADETEVPLLVDEALDRALRICRTLAESDERVALAFAQLGDRRARTGLAGLLHRRLVAPAVLDRFLARTPRDLRVPVVARRGAEALLDVFAAMPHGLDRFLETGPPDPGFAVTARTLRGLRAAVAAEGPVDPALVQAACARVREIFLTLDGRPRQRPASPKTAFATPSDWHAHRERVTRFAPQVAEALGAYRRDLNVLVARGLQRMYGVAEIEYRRTLDAHAALDFTDVLARTLDLLRNMEEFAQSRFRLESRYHHVLVDEFQDTSRAQWELVSLLVQTWGEGAGLAHSGPLPPSVFIVGDRKQSIYRFRDADVRVLAEARQVIEALRPSGDVRRSISRSFRSTPAILAFVNDVCEEMDASVAGEPPRHDAFRYGPDDRFPIEGLPEPSASPVLGLASADSVEACAAAVAGEIARLLRADTLVRDRDTGVPRPVRPGDVGVLFRTRESHREFEDALEQAGLPAYVYKGLGFFDADEVRDVLALVGHLADPASDLRAAAWLRSRVVRLSDEGLRRLAPGLAAALLAPGPPAVAAPLDDRDRQVFDRARQASARWRGLAHRLPPAELIDLVLVESAYAVELRGPRRAQARENLKKLRGIMRRLQNRGYLTLTRLAARLDRLSVGEEANATIDAADAVNLMTVHAAKGLEFPVVFVVNLTRGTGGGRDTVRIMLGDDAESVVIGDSDDEADEEARTAEREETRRLLYVALTRSRDRLYLAAVRRDGGVQPARGSLADVMPRRLIDLLGAPAGAGTLTWTAASGTVHSFYRCAGECVQPFGPAEAHPDAGTPASADFARIEVSASHRSVAEAVGGTSRVPSGPAIAESDRLIGTLVHRLMHRLGLDAGMPDVELRRAIDRVTTPEDMPDPAGVETLAARVMHAYRALAGRPDVRALYAAGEVWHEVPFACRDDDGGVTRGTIDCLVRMPDQVVVVEFKTGRPRPEHSHQAALYARAAAYLLPGHQVEVRLVHAGESV